MDRRSFGEEIVMWKIYDRRYIRQIGGKQPKGLWQGGCRYIPAALHESEAKSCLAARVDDIHQHIGGIGIERLRTVGRTPVIRRREGMGACARC